MKKFIKALSAYVKELGNLTPIALVTTFLPFGGSAILILAAYPLGVWLRENWEIGMPLFMLGVLIFCGLSLLPPNVIGIIAGWAFSFNFGITALIASLVGASLLSFLIHSRIVGDKLPRVFEAHPKANVIYEALVEQSVWRTTLIISLVRLTPAMPFALTNFLMASARVPLRSFVTGTFIGMLPRSSAVVFVGAGLVELRFDNPQNNWLILFGIIATIIAVIIIGIISRHAIERLTNEAKKTEVC